MWKGMTLIEGRECGACTVCCTWPTIDKPEIQKRSGTTCRHCTAGGCAIYETRYPICREYYCAWRALEMFGEEWRPDRSGVLPYVETEVDEAFDFSIGIGLMLIGDPIQIVRQPWFQDFVVRGVMNSVPLFLAMAGPTGCQPATILLNTDEMVNAIRRGAPGEVLEAMVKLFETWKFEPEVITHTGNDVGA